MVQLEIIDELFLEFHDEFIMACLESWDIGEKLFVVENWCEELDFGLWQFFIFYLAEDFRVAGKSDAVPHLDVVITDFATMLSSFLEICEFSRINFQLLSDLFKLLIVPRNQIGVISSRRIVIGCNLLLCSLYLPVNFIESGSLLK